MPEVPWVARDLDSWGPGVPDRLDVPFAASWCEVDVAPVVDEVPVDGIFFR